MTRSWLIIPTLLIVVAGPVVMAQDSGRVADRLLEELKNDGDANSKPERFEAQSWRDVADEMRRIARQLPEISASKQTLAAQSALIEELTKRLAKAQAAASSPAGSINSGDDPKNPARANASSTSPSGADQAPAATGKGPSTKAGSANQSGSTGERANQLNVELLVRRAWGQLPSRVRDRLQSGTPERFHEKYKAETESYFQRLSELEHRP